MPLESIYIRFDKKKKNWNMVNEMDMIHNEKLLYLL